jgi:molybdenum-dependent DNA-binding transcriptional regulator ModE
MRLKDLKTTTQNFLETETTRRELTKKGGPKMMTEYNQKILEQIENLLMEQNKAFSNLKKCFTLFDELLHSLDLSTHQESEVHQHEPIKRPRFLNSEFEHLNNQNPDPNKY